MIDARGLGFGMVRKGNEELVFNGDTVSGSEGEKFVRWVMVKCCTTM